MLKANYKISICTVCMNRLHQLKQTLIKNIEDNDSYDRIEFVILDYNSQDGMEEWAKENLSSYINNGKLVYYKTTQPLKWSPSHSKNLAFKLATGDIICNIWSDYFTGKNFAEFVNRTFYDNPDIVMTPIDFHKTRPGYHPPGDVLGKVCVRKIDFLKVHGFDERMNRHGFEDYDFVNRLELLNVKRVLIEDSSFLSFLPHDDSERNISPSTDLEALYVDYIDPSKSDCILLFKNGFFERGILIDSYSIDSSNYRNGFLRKKPLYQYSVEGNWKNGKWRKTEHSIELKENNKKEILLEGSKPSVYLSESSQQMFYKLESDDIVAGLLKFKHFHYTRVIMEENLMQKKVVVNNNDFGNGIVFKNFQPQPIVI